MATSECKLCGRPHLAVGLCRYHYDQLPNVKEARIMYKRSHRKNEKAYKRRYQEGKPMTAQEAMRLVLR